MVVFWVLAGMLAFIMLVFGGLKVVKTRTELQAFGMLWVEDYTDPQVRLIGAAEAVGAIGLIVPAATGIAPVLSPIAAACLGVLMAGAFGVHVKRRDPVASLVVTAALVAMAAYLAWVGFSG